MLAPNLETSQHATSQKTSKTSEKPSDNWYTPQHIIDLVIQVLNQIDLDPCAETGKNIPASTHYTHTDNGLIQPWHGRIFLNPPYSEPGKWITKLNEEIATGRVTEAIALVPGATDTNWLSPVLKTQPVCFWKGRIKFLDTNYKPKLPARQSHILIYWGDNSARFLEIFDAYGVVQLPQTILSKLLKTSPTNTYEIFLGDNSNTDISPRKNDEAPQPQFPEASQNCHSERSEESTISQNLREAPQFLGDKLDTNISPRKIEAFKFLGDKSDTNISPRKRRRHKGDGSGSIHWRTVTKKGKDYHEAYYHYEFWSDGEREVKSTRYIPKRLLSQVQSLDLEKAPVREILEVLGVL